MVEYKVEIVLATFKLIAKEIKVFVHQDNFAGLYLWK